MSHGARVCAVVGLWSGLLCLTACGGQDDGPFAEPPVCEAVFPTQDFEVVSTAGEFVGTDDPVDVYAPLGREGATGAAPVAVFLQGGRVDKGEYSGFAAALAGYGFWVFVPNHNHVVSLPGFETEGLFSEQRLLQDALDLADSLAGDRPPELADAVPPDLSTLVVLGHSYGAAAALAALQNQCELPFCDAEEFRHPPELAALALLGISMKPRFGSTEIQYTDNRDIPLALINGALDSNAPPDDVAVSYERIANAPKASIQIAGGNHYVMCDRDGPPGPPPDPASPTLEQLEGVALTAKWAATFLLGHINDDACSLYAIYGGAGAEADRGVTVEADLY